MRVCIEKSSGKMIESQSGDHAAYGALLGNAVSAGYAAEDVEEKVVTQDAFDVLWIAAAPTQTYAQKRKDAYASIGDQLDLQYHDLTDGTTTWRDHVAAVKAAHPKP
jgi:hypothetical protein